MATTDPAAPTTGWLSLLKYGPARWNVSREDLDDCTHSFDRGSNAALSFSRARLNHEQCGATSRSMLNDVMPLIKTLRLDKSTQMNLAVTSRFRDVKEIHINSLFEVTVEEEGTDEEFNSIDVDIETKIRAVPFLSRFQSLERVIFGGKEESGKNIEGFSPMDGCFYTGDQGYPDEGSTESLAPFECTTCYRACRSFPLESVALFESRGSSTDNARSGRMYGLDVCLQRGEIESILESRPGGKELLRTEGRLLRLLSCGRRYDIVSQGKPFCIVKYSPTLLIEIKRVIKYAGLAVEEVEKSSIQNAVLQSFAKNDIIPPKNDRYLCDSSLRHLTDEIGLSFDIEACGSQLDDLVKHVDQITTVLKNCHHSRMETGEAGEYKGIEIDCLKVIRRVIEMESNPPIRQVVDSEIVPYLAHHLMTCREHPVGGDEHSRIRPVICSAYAIEATSSLKIILTKGADEHRKMVIDEELIEPCSLLLGYPDANVARDAALILVLIFANIRRKRTDWANLGNIRRLINLFESDDDVCVARSLFLLALVSKDEPKQIANSPLISHLVPLMLSNKWMAMAPEQIGMLENASFLVRICLQINAHSVDYATKRNSTLIPRLIQLMNSNKMEHSIYANLAHVVIGLATIPCDQQKVFMQHNPLISSLAALVDSSDSTIANKAIAAVGNVAKCSHDHCKALMKAGILDRLNLLLKQSKGEKLRIASKAYSRCFHFASVDLPSTEDSLKLLTPLLLDCSLEVACNSCQAICRLLVGLEVGEVSVVINVGLIKNLLKLLPDAPGNTEVQIMKMLHTITQAGDEYIKEITLCNGIEVIATALSCSHHNAKHVESLEQFACLTISTIFSGNRKQIEIAIDCGVVPHFIKMFRSKQSRKHALWAIYQMIKGGNLGQIKRVVKQDLVGKLCDVLGKDSRTTTVSIFTLKNILKVGEALAELDKRTPSHAGDIQMIKDSIHELNEENKELVKLQNRLDLLEKKDAWLKLTYHQAQQFPSSIETKTTFVDAETPFGQAHTTLNKKEKETISFDEKYQAPQKLLEKAKEIAPTEELALRLEKGDLPKDRKGVYMALEKCSKCIESIKEKQMSKHRSIAIDAMGTGLRKLFGIADDAPTKKKKSRKKKVQTILTDFF
ncbi:hypothetical protein ACHAWF_013970 [Thalassiosira exigua]